ncbi:uncharacterized protein LOC109840882 [Asparagus officinalis]|uniref:uncharacterized protein LOC109840882 n=1 Tax=Asparagus officinalis TaxID=4686 RepID=UPI00098E150A|nr:uncharacterized protein LOC109840882 [Asparagus officinalis]
MYQHCMHVPAIIYMHVPAYSYARIYEKPIVESLDYNKISRVRQQFHSEDMAKFSNTVGLVLVFVMLISLFACHEYRDVLWKANKNGIGLDSDVCIQLPCPKDPPLCCCCRSTHNCFLNGEDKKTCEKVCPV